jgi:HlyD family secretion protein
MKKSWPLLVVILLAGALLWGIWSYFTRKTEPHTITASGTIETTEIQIGSRLGGRISAIHAKEGDNVVPGQTLVTLDPYQLPGQRAALLAQLAQAQAQLAELAHGPRPQEIAQARAQYQAAQAQAGLQRAGTRPEEIAQQKATLRQAQVNLQNDHTNYQRFQQLYQRQVVSRQEFENVRTTYQDALQQTNVARQKLLELQHGNRPQEIAAATQQAQAQLAQLQLLEAGTRPEQIAQQNAKIQDIKAQLQQLNETTAETVIKASCACQINSLDWRPGQLLAPNQTVASLYNLNDLWIRAYIPEERFGTMRVGDTVQVKTDAFPDRTFTGTVIQLASRAEFTPRNIQTEEGRRAQVFGVKITLDNRDALLRPGMPADVIFQIHQNAKENPAKGKP